MYIPSMEYNLVTSWMALLCYTCRIQKNKIENASYHKTVWHFLQFSNLLSASLFFGSLAVHFSQQKQKFLVNLKVKWKNDKILSHTVSCVPSEYFNVSSARAYFCSFHFNFLCVLRFVYVYYVVLLLISRFTVLIVYNLYHRLNAC
jgi:hypothetical protein